VGVDRNAILKFLKGKKKKDGGERCGNDRDKGGGKGEAGNYASDPAEQTSC